MKKYSFVLILSLFHLISFCQNDKYISLIEHYFKINPFHKQLTDIVDYYNTDPSFHLDSFSKETDNSFFYFRGYHDTFNPFSFPVTHLTFSIAQLDDSTNHTFKNDTIAFEIRVGGFIDSSEASVGILKKELSLLRTKFSPYLKEPGYISTTPKSLYPIEFYFFDELSMGWTYLPYYFKSLYITIKLRFYSITEKRTIKSKNSLDRF